jgi:hypothetical protein
MRILITLLSLIFVVSNSWSQQYFYKLYSGNGFDKGEDIIETSDSCYLVAGSSGSWGGNAQAFLMKIDSMGNYMWSQPYGGSESEESVAVMERPGSGFYIAGISNSSSQGNFDAMLIKTDLNGNQEWMKTYANPAWDRITDALMTKDTGIVMVGYRQSLLGSATDMLLMRMNKDGDTLWTKTIGTIGEDQATSVTRFQDSLYIVVGDMFVPDSNLVKGCMITFNDQGTILSQIMIGPKTGSYHLSDIALGEDKYYVVGYRLVNEQNHDNYMRIMDLNAVMQSQYTEADNSPTSISDSQFEQVVFMPDPTYMLSICFQYRNLTNPQFSYDLNNGLYDAANAYWMGLPTTVIINEGIDQCNEMTVTRDGGFISVGFNSIVNDGQNALNGGSNIYVMKYHPSHTQALLTDTVFTLNQLVETIELNQTILELTMYPNPTSNELHIRLSEQVSGDYFVSDLMGKRILTGKLASNFTIETDSWNKGVYFLNIGQHSFKFIKE